MLSGLGVSLPVGNADAGSYFNDPRVGASGLRCKSTSPHSIGLNNRISG